MDISKFKLDLRQEYHGNGKKKNVWEMKYSYFQNIRKIIF